MDAAILRTVESNDNDAVSRLFFIVQFVIVVIIEVNVTKLCYIRYVHYATAVLVLNLCYICYC